MTAKKCQGTDQTPALTDSWVGSERFIISADFIYALQATSPCIDRGDNNAPGLSDLSEDLAGKPRIHNSTVDRGAYEVQP